MWNDAVTPEKDSIVNCYAIFDYIFNCKHGQEIDCGDVLDCKPKLKVGTVCAPK